MEITYYFTIIEYVNQKLETSPVLIISALEAHVGLLMVVLTPVRRSIVLYVLWLHVCLFAILTDAAAKYTRFINHQRASICS